jgi:hypothetical protein
MENDPADAKVDPQPDRATRGRRKEAESYRAWPDAATP